MLWGTELMRRQGRNALGVTLKDRGNKLYSKKDYRRAVEWCPGFYGNLGPSLILAAIPRRSRCR